MKQPYVSTLIKQNFTSGEKARARDNIDAISSADLSEYATQTWVQEQGYLTSGDVPAQIPEASANQFLASDSLGNMEWKNLKLVDDRLQAGSYINLERQEYSDHVETTINCTGLQPSGDYVETSAIADMATQTWVNEQTSAFVTSAEVSGVLNSYATKQYVSSVAQGITSWASGEFYPLSNPSHFITSADIPPQTVYSAGPNIDIINDVISTEGTEVSAGANITVTSSLDNVRRIKTYTISGPGSNEYHAGQYIAINSNNYISCSGVQADLGAPQGDNYLTCQNGNTYWVDRNKYMYISDLGNHVITQTDLNNGYCDIPINWGVPSTSRVNTFSFCMGLSDMYAQRGGNYLSLETRVDKIKCSIYNEGTNTWYSNDNAHGSDPNGMVFEDILGSDLSRVTSYWSLNKIIKRSGMTGPYYVDFSGPSFRIVFAQNADLQVDDKIVMTGRISGIDFKYGGW